MVLTLQKTAFVIKKGGLVDKTTELSGRKAGEKGNLIKAIEEILGIANATIWIVLGGKKQPLVCQQPDIEQVGQGNRQQLMKEEKLKSTVDDITTSSTGGLRYHNPPFEEDLYEIKNVEAIPQAANHSSCTMIVLC